MLTIHNLKDKIEYLNEVITLEYDEWASNKSENREERLKNKILKVKNQLEEKDFCKLILLEDSSLIGFISIFPHDCDELVDLTPWYATMYVKKAHRGKGYSKLLNDAILNEAKKRGYKEIYLKTELKNYYEKFGAEFIKKITEDEWLFKFVL